MIRSPTGGCYSGERGDGSMTRRLTWMFGAVAVLAGCDDVRSEACDISMREVQTNGIGLNGIGLNGIGLNGIGLNGIGLNGDRLYAPDGSGDYVDQMSIDLKGQGDVVSATLVGSALKVVTDTGKILVGDKLDKVRFEFELQEGEKGKHGKSVWIRNTKPLAPGSDVWLYQLDYRISKGAWMPLCVDHEGEPTEAILLENVWNPITGDKRVIPGSITFACRDAALAKCVEWGYRPWASVGGTSLADLHQACTRLVRADYCGDGTPHTVSGTPIHVLDQLGVQKLDPNANFVIEAEWGPNGAVCLNHANMRIGAQPLACDIPACGAGFAAGGLIQSGKIVQ